MSAAWITSWPIADYVQQRAVVPVAWMNSLFRNEGDSLSSDLIRWAVAHTRAKWPDVPGLGIVSFVDASKTRRKRDPGRCYRRAYSVGMSDSPQAGLYAFQQGCLRPALAGHRGRLSRCRKLCPFPARRLLFSR